VVTVTAHPAGVAGTDRARLLDEIVTLVRAAHVEIMRVYARPAEAQLKADQSPLARTFARRGRPIG
jgi:hypothetical protein